MFQKVQKQLDLSSPVVIGGGVVAMFIGIFGLRMLSDMATAEPVMMLAVIPIAFLAFFYGLRWALAGAAFAFLLFVLWTQIEGVSVSTLGYFSQATAYLILAVTLGLAVELVKKRSAEAEREAERVREAQRKTEQILDATPEAFVSATPEGEITVWNRAAEETFGWKASEVKGRRVADVLVPPEYREAHAEGMLRYLASDRDKPLNRRLEVEAMHRDGSTFPVEMVLSASGAGAGEESLHAFMHDISERKQAERDLEDHIRDVRSISRITVGLTRSTDADTARLAACEAAAEVSGAPIAALYERIAGGTGMRVTAALGFEPNEDFFPAAEDSGPSACFNNERLIFAPIAAPEGYRSDAVAEAGARSALWQPVHNGEKALGVIAVGWKSPVAEVPERLTNAMSLVASSTVLAIERAGLLQRLQTIARTDNVTGLPNRQMWDDHLGREIEVARRSGRPLTIAMLRIPGIENAKDADAKRMMKQAAGAWQSALRSVDILARCGAVELGLLLPGCGLGDGVRIIRERAAGAVGIEVSGGVAEWDGGEQAGELHLRAEQALDTAAARGPGTIVPASLTVGSS